MPTILFIPGILIVLYFILIRPQQQRVRRQQNLVSSLQVGDQIVTIGGIIGHIVRIDGERAEIEVSDGVTIEFIRAAINRRIDDDGHRFETAADEEEEDEQSSDEDADDEEPEGDDGHEGQDHEGQDDDGGDDDHGHRPEGPDGPGDAH